MKQSRHATFRTRKGGVTVALLIALVILQLVIVGVVTGGARDHGLTARRVETMRAFYAAEAGMNMAMREVFNQSDEDGDGTIGSVSNNGNATDDPSMGTATFWVKATAAGTITTHTSTGRCGESVRAIASVTQ